MRLKLKIEPIPASTWGISLANKLTPNEWKDIRQKVYRDAGYVCEICGTTDRTLHCHEKWAFRKTSRNKGIQKLVKLLCVCELCHDCIHFGRSTQTRSRTYVERLMGHLRKVNRMSQQELLTYLEELRNINYNRADIEWIVKVGNRILY